MTTVRSRLTTLGLGFALLLWASPRAEATSITIENVTLTSTATSATGFTDTRTWCMIGCVFNFGAGNLWAAFANTVVNSPLTGGTQELVLTQNPTATVPGFNFDTSEHIFSNGTSASCGQDGGGFPTCTLTLTILTNLGNVVVPLNLNNALNNFNADTSLASHNEAQNWTQVLNQPGGLAVYIGYADNAHSDPCNDLTGTLLGNCLPDSPWLGSPNTVFGGAAITDASCARPGIGSCFDAGAIRIALNDPTTSAVPEPASMTLMLTGLVGFGARRYRQRKSARHIE